MLSLTPQSTDNKVSELAEYMQRQQIMRFLLVSTISTVIDYLVLFVLAAMLPQTTAMQALAIAVGYLVGTIINFILARAWVFTPTRLPIVVEFTLVAIIGGIGLGLTEVVTLWMVTHLAWHLLLAKTAAVVLVFFWNFLARRIFIYRK